MVKSIDVTDVLSLSEEKDYLGIPILGRITDQRNIELLQTSIWEEKKFNKPVISFKWVAEKYKENGMKYSREDEEGTKHPIYLYEAEHELTFVDVDIFRQPALHFQKYGYYCPFDRVDAQGILIMPDEQAMYWDTQQYRRKYGMTAWAGIDVDGNRRLVHCPGKLYGFMNFAPILKVEDDDDAISNDDEFKLTDDEELNAMMSIEDLLKGLGIKSAGTAKKAVDFPRFFDGQYHLFVAKQFARAIGKNFFFGKARRKGCSYLNAWDLLDDIDMNPNVSVILAAHDKKYLIHGKGLMKMLYTYADFMGQHTAFKKDRLVNNKEHLKFGYFSDDGTRTELGYKSEALAVSAQSNPDVTIGKDAFQLAYEELGKFPNFKESFEVTTSTAEAGKYKTGHICGWGTGGTDEANWEAFEDVVYNPDAYDNLVCNNIWDDGAYGTGCAYFYPHVQALEGCMDYNGNTDFEKSWEDYLAKKKIKRATTTDENAFEKWCGQRANCPAEAFARSATNIFNRIVINDQLKKIRLNPALKNLAREGTLVPSEKGIKLITNTELKNSGMPWHPPVNDYPLKKGTDRAGCIVEWFSPYRDPRTGKIPDGMYVAFQDPYAHDKDIKNLSINDSLGATYVFENVNNYTPHKGFIPVASYIGRPEFMDDYNEQVMYLLQYYNCKLMFENDRGDTKRFMQARRLLHYLFEEPEMQFARDLAGKTGRGYGMHMNDKRKAKGAVYLRDIWNTKVGVFPNGSPKLLYHFIYDEPLLQEALRWNMIGNFDRMSAWLIGAFIIKELEHIEVSPPEHDLAESFFNRPLY